MHKIESFIGWWRYYRACRFGYVESASRALDWAIRAKKTNSNK